MREGLLPLLFESEEGLPEGLRILLPSFRAMQRAQGARMATICRVFRNVVTLLEGEELIAIKGLDYGHRLYARPELRPMVDIDLLVQRERIDDVAARFRGAGFEQLFPAGAIARHAAYHERVFHIDGITVEPHHSFLQRTRLRAARHDLRHRVAPAGRRRGHPLPRHLAGLE